MSFVSKNLQSKQGGLTFIKGATLFFLGMSAVLFLTQAFDIVPSVTNRAQLIKEVLFTADGSQSGNTGAYIDGSGGNAYFAGAISGNVVAANIVCLNGDTSILGSCRTEWPTGGTAGGASLWSTGTNGIYYTGGNVGIGVTGPTEKLEIKVNDIDNQIIQIGLLDGINTPYIGSNTGLKIIAGPSELLDLYGNEIKIGGAGDGMRVRYSMIPPTTRVGINTGDMPAEAFYVNGKSQMGDNLKLYSNQYDGIIQTDDTSKIQFNTNGSNPRMTIDASGFVGINQPNPTANLDVVGTVKMLSSMKYGGITGNGSSAYTGGLNRYFPEGVLTGSWNNAVSTDTIRYLSCNTMTGGFLIGGFTGSNVHINGLNMYFLLPGQLTTTYNLKAGETFVVLNSCDDKLVVYRQNIGKDLAGTPPSPSHIDPIFQSASSDALSR